MTGMVPTTVGAATTVGGGATTTVVVCPCLLRPAAHQKPPPWAYQRRMTQRRIQIPIKIKKTPRAMTMPVMMVVVPDDVFEEEGDVEDEHDPEDTNFLREEDGKPVIIVLDL